ncbi:MAG: hypothetical protein BVN28_06600 [Nitrospira sp. ST-bin4]|nr:MAG: hypothetical protein BVN28_06600 [Nitrospira sp. ST-bin4]
MSLKDNTHILADSCAFLESVARARIEWRQLAGVKSVAYGVKCVGQEFTDEICILAYVDRKRARDDVNASDLVPEKFDGYRTDVRALPEIVPAVDLGAPRLCDNDRREPIIVGGIQIQTPGKRPADHPSKGCGTLGCIVRKKNDKSRRNVHLLTCAHVLTNNNANNGNKIYHPYAPGNVSKKVQTDAAWDTSIVALGPIDLQSSLQGDTMQLVPGSNPERTVPFFIDAAIARIEIDCTCCFDLCVCKTDAIQVDTRILGLNLDSQIFSDEDRDRITDVRNIITDPSILTETVCKVGRTTGRTFGRITAISPPYENAGEALTNVFEILLVQSPNTPIPPDNKPRNCQGTMSFCEGGDSGSIVVDSRNRAIGLLYGVAPDRLDTWTPDLVAVRYTYAAHIVPVLEKLEIRIPCTKPTNQWCAGAAEAWTPGPPRVVEEFPKDPATQVFASSGVVGNQVTSRVVLEELEGTTVGNSLRDDFQDWHREVMQLIKRKRPVTVTWHRLRGPAFAACAASHLRGETATIPTRIGEVTRGELFERMTAMLRDYGSPGLQDALARHRDILLALGEVETLEEAANILRLLENSRSGAPSAELRA